VVGGRGRTTGPCWVPIGTSSDTSRNLFSAREPIELGKFRYDNVLRTHILPSSRIAGRKTTLCSSISRVSFARHAHRLPVILAGLSVRAIEFVFFHIPIRSFGFCRNPTAATWRPRAAERLKKSCRTARSVGELGGSREVAPAAVAVNVLRKTGEAAGNTHDAAIYSPLRSNRRVGQSQPAIATTLLHQDQTLRFRLRVSHREHQ
jgi:hypothetical protein